MCAMCDQLESTATLDDETYEKARAEFAPDEYRRTGLVDRHLLFGGPVPQRHPHAHRGEQSPREPDLSN